MTWIPIARTTRPPERNHDIPLRPIIWQQLSSIPFKQLEILYDEGNLVVASKLEEIDGQPHRILVAKSTSSSRITIKPYQGNKYPKGYLTLDHAQRKERKTSERKHNANS
tara:strand:- start:73 stop:402 length:330 start_codon:yes stop_codon:yes gene_type:complete